jgi:hypothetical protein
MGGGGDGKVRSTPNFTYKTPWPLVRRRTIPTERPPLVGEIVPTFADRGVSRGQPGGSPTVVNLSFLDRNFTYTVLYGHRC